LSSFIHVTQVLDNIVARAQLCDLNALKQRHS